MRKILQGHTDTDFLIAIEETEKEGYKPIWETHKRYSQGSKNINYLIMEKK